jgi:hypothetical protein
VKKICKSCDRLLEEEEFDMWFPAIRVRKDNCKQCERRKQIEWYLKELRKQEEREKKKA